jgi:alkanesulfonate monooxygenase SsuD/methylene tetrahydromethanopterin reductase-like flavin-dependent oxidoreductase (luciferase family)
MLDGVRVVRRVGHGLREQPQGADRCLELVTDVGDEVAADLLEPQPIGHVVDDGDRARDGAQAAPGRVFVADTEAKAQQEGHNFFWQNGALNKQPREWMAPPGYASIDFAGARRLRAVSKPFDSQAYQEAQDNYQVVVGTPDQVIERVRYVRDTLGVGHMCLWAQDGHINHADTLRCIELFGKEVLPALRLEEPPAQGNLAVGLNQDDSAVGVRHAQD